MRSTFDCGGFTIHLGGTNHLSPPNCSSISANGKVPFSMTRVKFSPANTGDSPTVKAEDEYVCGFYLEPSHARAIASALLSAATEAKQ